MESDTAAAVEVDYLARQAFRDELLGLNLRALRERAAAAGLDVERVEDAIDLSEDPKHAVVALIIESNSPASGNARERQWKV